MPLVAARKATALSSSSLGVALSLHSLLSLIRAHAHCSLLPFSTCEPVSRVCLQCAIIAVVIFRTLPEMASRLSDSDDSTRLSERRSFHRPPSHPKSFPTPLTPPITRQWRTTTRTTS